MKATITRLFIALTIFFLTAALPGNDLKCQSENPNPLPQFLFPAFTKGIVQMKDGRKLSAVLNYNMVDEEMVFQQGKLYMVLDKPEEIDTIFLQNRRFIYVEKVFYELAAKGDVTIFIQNKSKYTQVASNTAYGMKSPTNATINVTTVQVGNQTRQLEMPENVTVAPASVYWARINGKMNKFTNQNQFLKLFPGSEDKIKEFIKTNKIDIKSHEGLMNLGNFCNIELGGK
jgi:hypothetical protein